MTATVSTTRTETLLAWARGTDAYRALVAPDASFGWPAVASRDRRVQLTVPVFVHAPQPRGPVELHPPCATLTLGWDPMEIAGFTTLPPSPGPVGTFPHPALGDSEREYLELRRRLFERYDALCASLAAGEEPADDPEFARLLRVLMEPALEPYHRHVAPAFFERVLAPAEGPRPQPEPGNAAITSERLAGWIREARRLVELGGSEAAAARLDALELQRSEPRAVVALAGSMKSGRSTLANILLGEAKLPCDASLSTATVIRIVHDREEGLDAEGGWDALHSPGGAPVATAEALFRTASEWLREHDMSILDTPGINTQQAELAERAASAADLVVMPVAALNPLDMTERAFLELVAAGGQRVLLVVTQLDRVEAAERGDVVSVIAGRASAHAAVAGVLTPAGHAGRPGSDELRAAIEPLLARDERRGLRARRTAIGLRAVCDELIRVGEERRAARSLDAEQRRRAAKDARMRLEASRREWDRLAIELEIRRTGFAEAAQARLGERRAEVEQQLSYELAHAPDPRLWWEDDLPYRLRALLTIAAQSVQAALQRAIDGDLEWLATEAQSRLAHEIERQPAASAGPLAPATAPLPELELRNLERMRMMTRAGVAAGPILGAATVVAIPLGLLAGALSGIGGELIYKRAVTEQRELIGDELGQIVNDAFGRLRRATVDEAFKAYHDVLAQLRAHHQAWLRDHIQALDMPPRADADRAATELTAGTTALKAEIEAIVGPGDGRT
jgi:hypothetical protein